MKLLDAVYRSTLRGGMVCGMVALASTAAWSSEQTEAQYEKVAYSIEDRYRPTPFPDRILLCWSGDPSTTIDITWRTDSTAASSVVQYAPAAALRGNLQAEVPGRKQQTGWHEPFESDLGPALVHWGHLDHLQPATKYAYRVGDGRNFSEWIQFRTASDSPAPFSFVYFGDAQNDVRSWWSRVVREASQHAPQAAFMLHAGDLINNAGSDRQWGEWFEAGGWLNGMIPSIATPGNHPELRQAWQPTLEKHGVDLVLQGHDHAYLRTGLGGPVNLPIGLRRTSSNTVYVVSVSGPKMYELDEHWHVPRVAAGVQLFQIIRVHGNELRFEARLASGELYDAFTLRKSEGGTNELINETQGLAAAERWQKPDVDSSATAITTEAPELSRADAAAVGMSADKLSEVMPAVQKLVDDKKVAGAIVGVVRHGKLVLLEAAGYSDIEAGTPLEEDAILRFYSMTKPITSVAVMMLLDEGKLGLDDPVAQHVPEFADLTVYVAEGGGGESQKEPDSPMTIRDLLRHTSGLTYGFFGSTPVDLKYVAGGVLSPTSTLDQMASKLSKIPLLYQPGTRFNYSVSTDVLGLVVQRVSGQPFDEFLKDRIFEPLEMTDTAFYVPSAKADRLANNYAAASGDGTLRVIDGGASSTYLKPPTLCSGGGGLVSTARDYLHFCAMLLGGGEFAGVRLLQEATVKEMTRNQLPEIAYPMAIGEPRAGVGFGLGFSVIVEQAAGNEDAAIGEYGWGGAASTHFWISPRDDVAVVALSQLMPFSFQLERTVKPLVYEAIEDRGP